MDDKIRAKILAQVLFWALEQRIEVRLFTRFEFTGDSDSPTLRFSRNDKHIELSLWRITDDRAGDYFKHELRRVGLELLVKPFEPVEL